MRQIIAIALLSFAVVFTSHADNDDIQQGIFTSYLRQAADGDAVAQYVVAQRYETGRGTEKNLEKAYYWYEMAAKQSYPLAVVKIEEHNKEQAKAKPARTAKPEKTHPAPVAKTTPPKKEPKKKPAPPRKSIAAKPKPAKVPVAPVIAPSPVKAMMPRPVKPAVRAETPKQKINPPPQKVVARAPVVMEPPMPAINVIQALLNGKWKRNHQDAEFLPSARATCLQSGNTEVVCFSQELTRNVGNAGVTYNVKSVISRINNKEARFNLRYVYNVMDIADKRYAQPNGMSNEANDMAAKAGWQEPGTSMECRLRDERLLTCTRADRKMTYQFMRE